MIEFKEMKNLMLFREKLTLQGRTYHNSPEPYANLPGWFDVRVFYVRVSSCLLDEAPDSVIVRLPPRSIEIALEVNGGRIPPSEEASLLLRRDRMDAESEEVIYVNTDNLRASESIIFEVYDREDLLISGILEKKDHLPNGLQGCEESDIISVSSKSMKSGWKMECSCGVGSSGCAFFKDRRGHTNICASPPSMEICVVGRCIGSPVILTQTIQLTPRRRSARRIPLDAIPEDTQPRKMQISLTAIPHLGLQEEDEEEVEDSLNKSTSAASLSKFYPIEDGFLDGEDGESSWFNAGVRVGVGIGLGICLGLGIGVGLLVRTYQTTSRPFRRRFL
ncbi:hypothetical protein O6H91_03G054900 [Diphasiastrum complanatum]|uniref:Uncharacterized protein n=1 Tax=Diphasiastrum complanatum TaxID=34168 RepID=A0ACC2E6T8_DIPCM|nr:hypothetical protein O6H91_03G054900 [Diphasiastrum complanatum]